MPSDKEEMVSSTHVRCPRCGHEWRVDRENHYHFHFFEAGVRVVDCNECDYHFRVTTFVTFTFESPEMVEESW